MTYTKAITLLDGAMGTMLQRAGLKLGDRPETLSITAADVVEKIDLHIVPHTFTSGFFSPNFSLSVSQISLRSFPCFSMLLMVL